MVLVARELGAFANPLSHTEKTIAWVAGSAVLAVAAYYIYQKVSTPARTAAALDNYSVVISSSSASQPINTLSAASMYVTGATVTGFTPAASGTSATLTMTAPPNSAPALTTAVNQTISSWGLTAGPVTDTGIAVQ